MRIIRWAAALVVAAAALTGAAFAHVSLKASNIGAAAIIETLPAAFEIEFSQAVGLTSFAIETDAGADAAGAPIALDYAPPKGMHATFAVPLPRLTPGAYVAKWRIMAKDGHAMNGEIRFTLAAPKTP